MAASVHLPRLREPARSVVGLRIAPNGQVSSQSRHLMHSSGVMVTRHFDSLESCRSITPYGHKNRQ